MAPSLVDSNYGSLGSSKLGKKRSPDAGHLTAVDLHVEQNLLHQLVRHLLKVSKCVLLE